MLWQEMHAGPRLRRRVLPANNSSPRCAEACVASGTGCTTDVGWAEAAIEKIAMSAPTVPPDRFFFEQLAGTSRVGLSLIKLQLIYADVIAIHASLRQVWDERRPISHSASDTLLPISRLRDSCGPKTGTRTYTAQRPTLPNNAVRILRRSPKSLHPLSPRLSTARARAERVRPDYRRLRRSSKKRPTSPL